MTTTFTILPDIGGVFLVRDFGSDGAIVQRDIPVLPREPFTISISPEDRAGGLNNKDIIKIKLTELIKDAIEVGMTTDIAPMIEEYVDSPPQKIVREQDWITAIKQRGRNSFQVIQIKKGNKVFNTRSFGKERVFKLAPADLVYDNTEYFKPNQDNLLTTKTDTASCAFQYIYQKYGKKKGFIKKARDFETIKRLSTTDPPQFRNWITQYQKEYNLEKLGLETQYPVIELESFETELYDLKVVEIKEQEWSEEEEYNSMSVLDIVRWCMWAGMNCYVVDYDGHYYLSYNDSLLNPKYNDRKNTSTSRFSLCLKVKNNHAYFVEDSNLKASVSQTLSKYNMEDFDDVGSRENSKKDNNPPPEPPKGELNIEEQNEYEEKLENWIKENKNQFYISPTFYIKQVIKEGTWSPWTEEEWMGVSNISPWEDFKGFVDDVAKQRYKNSPPPLPDEFLTEENRTFYLEAESLNGIIRWIKEHKGVSPSTMNGAYPHKIDRASYGKTKLFSRRCNINCFHEYQLKGLMYIWKNYPNLSLKQIPTPTQIATEIFNKHYKDKRFWSMFNSNTKRAFFDGEIKADNRVVKEVVDSDVFSIDLKRAYTNSLRNSDVAWGVYDGLCQFIPYKGEFRADAFYLVKELVDEYPLRGLSGLVLYHGCFLRNILDKVEIKQVIYPVRRKPCDYFGKFVEEVENFEEGSLISSKVMINSFIGSMKNQDKISNYKIYETESDNSAMRAFYSGSIVSELDEDTKLISKPIMNYNIQSAQPIRLQVIDSINEKLYKLYFDYKLAFGRCPLAMVKTDALYIETEGNWYYDHEKDRPYNKKVKSFCDSNSILCDLENIVCQESWDFKKAPTTQKDVRYKGNCWRDKIDINKRWTKDTGAKLLFNLIHKSGGALLNGEAGVGKSELMNCIEEEFIENRKNYKWMKLIVKLMGYDDPHQVLEDWRNDYPCFAIKLAPTNKATNRIGGKTLHKGLGVPILDLEESDKVGYFEKKCQRIIGGYSKNKKTGKSHHKPCFDYIEIDEISMMDGYFWSILFAIKERAPRIKFLLSGDIIRQLPPVGEEKRNFIGAYLLKELVNHTRINLNYNFRNGMIGNILWDDWSKNPERFKITPKEIDQTELNLCFFNSTRKRIIADWNKLLKPLGNKLSVYDYEGYAPFNINHPIYKPDGQTDEIYFMIGSPMIANKSIADLEIAKNERWRISKFDDETITLTYEDKEVELEREEVYNNFYSGYAITIHKSQGDTYEERYTIWDWKTISEKGRLKRKLRYVAQSRSKKPEKNILYKD